MEKERYAIPLESPKYGKMFRAFDTAFFEAYPEAIPRVGNDYQEFHNACMVSLLGARDTLDDLYRKPLLEVVDTYCVHFDQYGKQLMEMNGTASGRDMYLFLKEKLK